MHKFLRAVGLSDIKKEELEKICKDIEAHSESFARYYSISRICMNTSGIRNICIALIINDDVYEYSEELKNK